MELTVERDENTVVLMPDGRIDGMSARDFQESAEAAVDLTDNRVVVDLGGITYISSAGLRVMLMLAKALKQRNVDFLLCSMSPPIQEVFHISGFDKIMSVHPDRATALAAK